MELPGQSPETDYFKVKNDWFDALIQYRLPGIQMQCVLFIIRKTYGWQKKEAEIQNIEFSKVLGVRPQHICRALNELEMREIINVTKNGNKRSLTYSFNKYYSQWKAMLPKMVILPKMVTSVTKNGNKVLPKMVTVPIKDNIKTIKDKLHTSKKNGVDKKALAVLRYLNRKKKSKYRDFAPITARLKEGCTIQECLTVIDNKFEDDYFQQNPRFLNPQTLFRKSHWDKYLNDTPPVKHELDGKVSPVTIKNIETMKEWAKNAE